MGKKNDLEDLLNILTPGSSKDKPKGILNLTPEKPVEKQDTKKEKNKDGILSPIMNNFTTNQKFDLISGLMDFAGGFLIKLIDYYSLELSKIENSISVIQSKTLHQIRTIRTRMIKARQEGMFVKQKGPKITTGREVSIAVATQGPPTKAGKQQPTKEDVQNIALQIRQLIKRQKDSRSSSEIMGIKIEDLKTSSIADIKKSSIESKLAEYKESQAQQEERLKKKAQKPTTRKKTTKKSTKKTTPSTKKPPTTSAKPLPASFKKSLISNIKVKLKDLEEEKNEEDEGDEESQEE
ncbi:MAG: hypothetical protein ACFFCS_07130 [Candidatus Hodarchaeota archaeon]